MTKRQGQMLTDSDYVRGLRDASVVVSKESGKRREAGEMPAMYALNAAWHAIVRLIDKEEAKAKPTKPPAVVCNDPNCGTHALHAKVPR